jgi:hypothetical protein
MSLTDQVEDRQISHLERPRCKTIKNTTMLRIKAVSLHVIKHVVRE